MRLSSSVYYYQDSPTLDFSTPDFSANSIIIDGPEKIIIDPGTADHWPKLERQIINDGLNPGEITMAFFTHSHQDHLEAGLKLAEKFKTSLSLSRLEYDYLINGSCRELYQPWVWPMTVKGSYSFLSPGPLTIGPHQLELISTPGHSPGSMSFYWPEEKLLVVGDLYFQGTIGAIDLPGGCPDDMFSSIERLEALNEVETVLCGHGPAIMGRPEILANYQRLNAEIETKKRQISPHQFQRKS